MIVYRTKNTTGAAFVYDALNGAMFGGTAQFNLLHPGLDGEGRFTMAGADGQRGSSGYDNVGSNELTFFNGNQIAGPPVASSDWMAATAGRCLRIPVAGEADDLVATERAPPQVMHLAGGEIVEVDRGHARLPQPATHRC